MGWTVLGQEPQVDLLRNSIAAGRVAHAYLVSGPAGVGKSTLVLNFAAALNCDAALEEGEPCWVCPSCLQVGKQAHPDVHWIEPEGSRVKIDQVRDLQRELALHPYQGRFKVGVIQQAEKMTPEAANSLLKTLEEPIGNAVLILMTTTPRALLPTILSRCLQVNLRRLPAKIICEALAKEGIKEDQARVIASISEGSLGRALEAVNSGFLESRHELYRVLIGLKSRSAAELIDLAERLSGDREMVIRSLELVRLWFSDLLMGKIGNESGIVNRDLAASVFAECKQYDLSEIISALDLLEETLAALAGYANQELALDVLLLRLAGKLDKKVIENNPA